MSGANLDYRSRGSETNEPANPPSRRWLRPVCQYILAAVFLMAAVSKIVDLRGFESQVLSHSELPVWLGKAASIVPGVEPITGFHLTRIIVAFLPWLELTCGLCLAFGWAVREAALTAGFLLFFFLLGSIVSPSDNCHCFFIAPALSHLPWWTHSLRDAGLLLCAAIVVFRRGSK